MLECLVNEVVKELPLNFKKNLKLPANLPFDVSNVNSAADLENYGGRIDSFEAVWAPNNGKGIFSVTVIKQGNDLVSLSNEQNTEFITKKVKLAGGTTASFLDTQYTQQLEWLDSDSGYLYNITAYKDRHNPSRKYTSHNMVEIANSMKNINNIPFVK